MKNPRLIDLQIKIASLSAESRIIREKENALKHKAHVMRGRAIAGHKGIKIGPNETMPDDLAEEATRRVKPNWYRLIKQDEWQKADEALFKTTRKAIRKWLRGGLTKEEILALPGVQRSLQYSAKLDNLAQHRKHVVRPESRHSQLAYAFLRGRAYSKTEDKAQSAPNWDYIQRVAERFSNEDKRIVAQRLEQWIQEARLLIDGNALMKRKKQKLKLAA